MPHEQVQEQVLGIVDSVLACGPADPGETFAALGGDSIEAVQVLSECWRRFGAQLPLTALRSSTTIAELVASIEGSPGADATPAPGDPLERTVGEGAWRPATARQRAMYAIWQARPDSPTYNVPVALRLSGPFDPVRFARTAAALVRRHEALRTVFGTDDGGRACLLVRPDPVPPPCDVTDLTSSDDPDADAERRMDALAAEPLDLAESPLRIHVLRSALEEHTVLIVIHHILCDGWSLNVLLYDLCRIYETDGADLGPDSSAAARRIATAGSERGPDDRVAPPTTWAEVLGDTGDGPDLPTDRARGAVRGNDGARIPLTVPPALLTDLRRQASALRTTPFALLAVAFGVLLGRYGGRWDPVVGVPMADRYVPGSRDVVGHLTDTVPVRLDLRADPTLRSAVERVARSLAASEELAGSPPATTGAGAPFDVALIYLTNGAAPLRIDGLDIRRTDLGTHTAKFEQSWYLEERDDALTGYVEFATDLFDLATVRRMAAHLDILLRAVTTAQPDRRIGTFSLFQERDREAVRYSPPTSGRHPDRSVVDLFAVHVHERPGHPALWWSDGGMSYRELHDRAADIASALRAQGVGHADLVGICLDRSAEQVAHVLGTLMAGAAFLSLDPAYPAERLRYMAGDSGAALVVARTDLVHEFTGRECAVAGPGWADGTPPAGEHACTTSDDLAYVIYTSGSTGKPKGVELTHGSLANVMEQSVVPFGLGPKSRVLQFVSPSFDASVWETFMALCSGGTLCLGPPDVTAHDQSVHEVVRDAGATVVFLPPAVLTAVDPCDVPSVGVVVTGGDRVTADLRDRWAGRARFFAAYGPTEATIVQTWGECPPSQVGPPPIGTPFPGVRLYVLDDDLEPVPLGAVGEVYIGGPAVGRGYRGRPATTADRFLPDLYGEVAGARMYRTGDLVRRRTDGELGFVGRTDRQVKIRGLRIEVGEIEQVLTRQDEVAEALVRAEQGADHGAGPGSAYRRRLCGYVVAAPGVPAGDLGPRLIDRLRAELPEYLVPARVHVVAEFPRTVNGKIDHAALDAATVPVGPATDPAYLADLVGRLDSMTDEEARELLARTTGGTDHRPS